MPSEPFSSGPPPRPPALSEEDRIEAERAEERWRHQLEAEASDVAGSRFRGVALLRWLVIAITGALLIFFFFERLAWIG
ncbi:MAG: hypothetical protein JO267_12605 [Alphaproteobacteria bacterium]|nr:hypothetical protein [Alphaproteobacteria bacterium]